MVNTFSFSYETTLTLTEEDITDIVITAIEGSINYWACLDNTGKEFENTPKDESVSETVAKILLDGGKVTFIDEEDDYARYELTLKKLLRGIRKYASEGGFDMDLLDSDMADCIVQYAVFGELVYC